MSKPKGDSEANRRIIQRCNDNPPTRQQLTAWIAACDSLPKKDHVFEMQAITWTKLFPNAREQGVSAMFRLQALAEMVSKEPLPGWSDPEHKGKMKGAHLTRKDLFAAAAAEPLVLARGALTFNRESLLKRAFQLAKRTSTTDGSNGISRAD